jgi:membrane fusion protein (multidrug efflux system)
MRKTSIPIAAVLLACGILGLVAGCSEKAPPPAPPPEVQVTSVVQKDVPIYTELPGQTLGSEDIEIRPRVEGYLVSVNFTEGSFVKKGQLLYRIDPQPFEAALSEARANLNTAQARLEKTKNDVNRLTPLAKVQAVSQQELDNAVSAQEAAQSQVAANDARVSKAKLDLAYTTITSPTDGIIGTTKQKVGALVGRGETAVLNTVSQVDPILFRCAISEAEYLRIARRGKEADKVGKFGVELILADGSVFPHKGSLDAVERAIDPTTGTLTGQFKFPNPEKILRPNQYGRARFVTDYKDNAVLVPQLAVQEIQGLYSVMVVKADDTVDQRMVKASDRVGNLWVIDSGLKPGEKVIVEGIQKVKPGIKVIAKTVSAERTTPAVPSAMIPLGKREDARG